MGDKATLIGRRPEVLANLKSLAISLDEERMGAEHHKSKPNPNRNTTEQNQQATMQVKTEIV